jgi:hypothetical protein
MLLAHRPIFEPRAVRLQSAIFSVVEALKGTALSLSARMCPQLGAFPEKLILYSSGIIFSALVWMYFVKKFYNLLERKLTQLFLKYPSWSIWIYNPIPLPSALPPFYFTLPCE